MSALAEALATAGRWRFAARVDLRRGDVVELHRATGADPPEERIHAAIELLRGPLGPSQLLVASDETVEIGLRCAEPRHEAVVVVAERDANVGLLVASLRRITEVHR